MHIQLVRHATLRIEYKGRTLLVDPMFSQAGELPTVPNTPNQVPNPLVDLPMPVKEVLAGVDAILITHTHRDHLDEAAIRQLPKSIPLFCQPADQEKLASHGFEQVIPVETEREWEGIGLWRTGGQHGTGEIGKQMGPVSGFVLKAAEEPALYVAGDTIWCEEAEQAVNKHKPDVIVVFSGAARFLTGDPITMTAEDVGRLAQSSEAGRVFVAHMETWNHCLLSRTELREHLDRLGLSERVHVPEDGEIVTYRQG